MRATHLIPGVQNLSNDAMQGIVVRAHGKYFVVEASGTGASWLATPRGTLKRGRLKSDPVVVGDVVWFTDAADGEARIEHVEPRRSALVRPARGSAQSNQIILANPDQVMFIFAVAHPAPHRRMLDRFLVLAEDQGIPAIIGINKIDLDVVDGETGDMYSRQLFGDYESIYALMFFSVRSGAGIESVRRALAGKTSVLAGPSGVGKSSLLNSLEPTVDRRVGVISEATGKGRHTTTTSQLFRIGADTFLADTPGIRSLAMSGVPVKRLDHCFREFRPFLGHCFYADCAHLSEPGCAVLQAVDQDTISGNRYESYASLRRGDSEK